MLAAGVRGIARMACDMWRRRQPARKCVPVVEHIRVNSARVPRAWRLSSIICRNAVQWTEFLP